MEIQPFAAHFDRGIEVDNAENTVFLDKPGQTQGIDIWWIGGGFTGNYEIGNIPLS